MCIRDSRRIINVPKRGIGLTSVNRVQEYALARELGFYEALMGVCLLYTSMEHLISMLEKEQVIDITEEELDSLYRIMTKIKKNLIRIQVGGEEEEYASDNFERSERI